MNKYLLRVLPLLAIVVLLSNCRKKEWDAYYGRPDTLELPIYQQLQAKGNFKSLLAAIDKAGYKDILSAAGYWTFFAPHDSAFGEYFKEKNISGIEQLDSTACQKIITYSLVYNAFKKERIGDYQSTAGWVKNGAFRRRTASYTGVYDGVDTSGKPIKAIASNRNNNGTIFYVETDNNNKYIPYFVDNFMASKGLTAADYNYFYPNTRYTGFNVVDAVVTEQDVPAENGVIHVVNKVITTLPSLDEYLGSNPEYSEFKKLFDRFLVNYTQNATATQKYQNLRGVSAPVFTKIFNNALNFSPNNENFVTLNNDGQFNSYTMFAPNNAALTSYINNVLLEHYTRLEDMPINIITDFVNAHLWQAAVWPSKFKTTFNTWPGNQLGEEARFDPATDILEKRFLSNGIFYGTNKVQESNLFSSVYGKAYLDPKYSMMTSLLNQDLKFQIANIRQPYTLFLVSNEALNRAGYFADPTVSNIANEQWRYTPPGGGATVAGSSALVRLLRVLNLLVVPGDLTSMGGSGVAKTYGGEFVRFENNKLWASGNRELVTGGANSFANVNDNETKTALNGTVYYLDTLLTYSNYTLGSYLSYLGTPATSDFNFFWNYLRNNTSMYNSGTGEINIAATGSFFTFLVPTNAAIQEAIKANLLPGTVNASGVATPKYTGLTQADTDKVEKFVRYHILKGSIATNGEGTPALETLYSDGVGATLKIGVDNDTPNVMELTDAFGRKANVILSNSNHLGNRIVIHSINSYLRYTE
jgi:uncharacterized surface protein with fasciclin (FAS1) repeats